MASEGFARYTGPIAPSKSQTPFGNFPRSSSPTILSNNSSVQQQPQRSTVSPPGWGNQPESLINNSNSQTHQRPSTVAPYVASHNTGASIPAKPASSQFLKRTRSPPVPHANEDLLGSSGQDVIGRLGTRVDLLYDNGGPVAPQKMWSPPLAFDRNHSVEDLHRPSGEAQRPALFPSSWGNQPRLPVSNANSLTHQGSSPVGPYVGSRDGGTGLQTKPANPVPKRTRSPPFPSRNEVFQGNAHPIQDANHATGSAFVSPPRSNKANSHTHQKSSLFAHNIGVEGDGIKSTTFHVPKRTRSPPLPSADENFVGDLYSTQDDSEREIQAKAKRLARFSVELSQPVQGTHDITKHKLSGTRHDQPLVEKRKLVVEHPVAETGDFSNGSILPDYEGLESSHVIIGLCPDMCPESEREERERKGDLDKYERLDGDRNQTSKFLAVKKYNRTAEREADLIRPMPVLQMTIDYLLALLDQPYDGRLLGMYNFLWDRMRAIRMDLRMQHIFNGDAITMLEQMIRLHIIVMHELCEYTKGEGFSEGFDAHLNIEQMNKTSVELFQMYDDHRKKGIGVPTEKEFRGYYALLKLDKHPGYKVEPAELSLDLAKMTTEIRQTPEVLFAREVARACRTGNFIAFFRLARKATYLQACLMHAHFAKLRTQALASLHSGLQNNQGLPVTHVTKWLGMEEEDIESLLEYHGFMIKEFEESYMVKEGPFLNSDKDYQTKCSNLVHLKKSRRIIDDVAPSSYVVDFPVEEAKQVFFNKIDKFHPKVVRKMEPKVDEEMSDFEPASTTRDESQVHPMLETSSTGYQDGNHYHVANMSFKPYNVPFVFPSSESLPSKVERVGIPASGTCLSDFPGKNLLSSVKGLPLQTVSAKLSQVERSFDSVVEDSVTRGAMVEDLEIEEVMVIPQEVESAEAITIRQENEASQAKLKLILRIWKRRSSKRRELREQRQLAANAALNSLPLGPPIRQNKIQPSIISELNIDHVVRERDKRHRRLWSRLNVSEVVEGILSERNPDAKCICWKIVVCFQMNDTRRDGSLQRIQNTHLVGPWMLSKLMGVRKDDDDLLVSSPGLSIWKKWLTSRYGSLPTCCLSVIKDIEVDKSNDTLAGASAVLFLVSESTPWELQKLQLHNLLMSLPCGSRLPLLIVSGMYTEEEPDSSFKIINGLGLHDMDKTKINSFSIIFLVRHQPLEHFDGIFSDDRLREGLQWLASHSPLQPVLRRAKTRELVMNHMNTSLEVLDKMNVSEVSPNHCISVFNEALDRSADQVAATADMNPACWPCPEIDMLEKSSDERRAVNWFLPSVGWSSAARVEPIIRAIKSCKLPFFLDDLSWLSQGSDMGKEIQDQKSELEKYLVRYLTQCMGCTLAAREASVMLQKGARLELHGSSYCIVPIWVVIFRRVFNWQLMSLTSGVFSVVYLEHGHESYVKQCDMVTLLKHVVRESNTTLAPPMLEGQDNSRFDGDRSPPYALSQPSLDEMVEFCCGDQSEPEFNQPLSGTVNDSDVALEATTASDFVDRNESLRQDNEYSETGDFYLFNDLNKTRCKLVVVDKEKKQSDKLSKLLEQCYLQQNRNDEKLAIYF